MSQDPKHIRNVVLLGHSHCGKTSLIESMLYESKAITRRGTVEAGNTVSDFSEIEQERKSSLFSKLMHVSWKESKINIIDTPGSDDYVGETLSSMKVADLGLMVINSSHGVEVGTELIWEYADKFHLPMLFIINHCDHEKSDYDGSLEQARERFGHKLIPFQYPVQTGQSFNAIIDALRMVMYEFPSDGGKPTKKPIPAEHMEKANSLHNAIVEAAAENDDTLMDHYFEPETWMSPSWPMGSERELPPEVFFQFFAVAQYAIWEAVASWVLSMMFVLRLPTVLLRNWFKVKCQ